MRALCRCAQASTGACEVQKRVLDALELQQVASFTVLVWGTELGSSTRATFTQLPSHRSSYFNFYYQDYYIFTHSKYFYRHMKTCFNMLSNGSQPMGRDPFGVTCLISCTSDVYIMMHNSSKINYGVARR